MSPPLIGGGLTVGRCPGIGPGEQRKATMKRLLTMLVAIAATLSVIGIASQGAASAGTYTCHIKGETWDFPSNATVDAYPYYGTNYGKVDYCDNSDGNHYDKMSVVAGTTGADVVSFPTTWNWPNIQANRIEVKLKVDGSADGISNWHICSDSGYLPNAAGSASVSGGPWDVPVANCVYKWLAGIVTANYNNGVNGWHSVSWDVDWPNEGCTSFGTGGDLNC